MSIGTKNPFFEFSEGEQNLLEDLICEAVTIYGVSCSYIARNYNNLDQIYGQDDSSSYTYSWPMALYVKNVLGFAGDREFMDKFAGLQIRDQMIFSIPMRTFNMIVSADANFPPLPNHIPLPANRPREGDLIFVQEKHLNKCFQIKYVNLTDAFWQLGKLYTWDVTCELFEYSGEQFNTGIPEIDRIQVRGDLNFLDYLFLDTDGVTPLLLDPTGDWWCDDSYNIAMINPLADNQAINNEANGYINFSNSDPFTVANNGLVGTI